MAHHIDTFKFLCSVLPPAFNRSKPSVDYTGCPTRYRTRHFFNNFTTVEKGWLAGGPLLRVTIIRRTTDTHYRHIPLHFSHNERTPVQISLQYLHWC